MQASPLQEDPTCGLWPLHRAENLLVEGLGVGAGGELELVGRLQVGIAGRAVGGGVILEVEEKGEHCKESARLATGMLFSLHCSTRSAMLVPPNVWAAHERLAIRRGPGSAAHGRRMV